MKVKTLEGQEYEFVVGSKVYNGNKRKPSKLHIKARELLKQKYPNTHIYEEQPATLEENLLVFFDFYIPSLLKIVEVNGRQHYEHVPHYHKNKLDFLRGQTRDKRKQEWCDLNGIEMVVLKYDEVKDWESFI